MNSEIEIKIKLLEEQNKFLKEDLKHKIDEIDYKNKLLNELKKELAKVNNNIDKMNYLYE